MLQQKKFWAAMLVVLSLLTSGFYTTALAAGKQGTISVVGTNQSNSLSEKTVPYGDNETALTALVGAEGVQNVDIQEYSGLGKYINGIDGLTGTADYKYYWSYFINGIAAPTGVDNYIVQDGDQLSFQYVSGPPTNSVSLSIVDKNGKELAPSLDSYPIGFIGQPTAMQLLKVVAGPQRLNYQAFMVNGQPSAVSPENYPLHNGDKISFQFDSWSEPAAPAVKPLSSKTLQTAIDHATNYYKNKTIGEWEAVAFKQAGKNIPSSYLDNVKTAVQAVKGNFRSITDSERYSLGILAAGGDPSNIGGYNLIQTIYNGNVTKQGLNGVAYALIALDSANFKVPDTAQWNREKLVSELLAKQNKDGGWTWDPTSATSDVDTTAMVLTALAPHKNDTTVKAKIDSALLYVTTQYINGKIDNSSTAAEVIIALSALGIDANSPQFTRNGTSLIQYLLTFQNTDGGFDWKGGSVSDDFSTSEGIQAVVAYQLYTNGKGSLYSIPLQSQKVTSGTSTDKSTGKQTSSTVQGHTLPDTATNGFNFLVFGLFILLTGIILFLNKKRKA